MGKILPREFTKLLESYISNKVSEVKQEAVHSELEEINIGVPQGLFGPVLPLLYSIDIP